MFDRSKTTVMKENAAAAGDLAKQLAADKRFRKQLLAATGHGVRAKRQARRQIGLAALGMRLASDRQLRMELVSMARDLQGAWKRVERSRGHGARNTLLAIGLMGGTAAAFATPRTRQWLLGQAERVGAAGDAGPRVIDASIEVAVPVHTAYDHWTQFEEFPRFMEGVDEVRQLDDTRLHWVASIGGKRVEWDAKILEQHPDRQISWISEDGKKTRGTVSFEKLGENRTLIRLSMSYQAEGAREALGSAVGLDSRRVRGDLQRFKELSESGGGATGAWRGDISAGETKAKTASPASAGSA